MEHSAPPIPDPQTEVRTALNTSRAALVARYQEAEQLVQLDLLLPASLFRHMAEQYALERASAQEMLADGRKPALRYQNFNDYLVETLKDVFFGATEDEA